MQTEQTAALTWCAAALQAAIPFDDMESSIRLFDTGESKTVNEILDLANAALATKPAGAADSTEPVARVDSFTNGSYSRNYKVTWLRDVPEGTLLYRAPIAAEAVPPASCAPADLTDDEILACNKGPVCGVYLTGPSWNKIKFGRAVIAAYRLRASNAAEPAGGEAVALCARIMGLVDEYHEHPHRNTRYAIRAALMDDWAPNRATPPQAPAVPAGLSDAPIEFKTFSVYADTEFRDADGKLMAVVRSGKHHKRMTTALRAALAASAPGAELGKDQQ